MRRPRFKPSIASTRCCRLAHGRAERHGFEYYRHGTLSLYAALNTKSGKVLGQTAARHTTEEFVAFLGQIAALQPKAREIHIIADNLSAHKTKRVAQFLADHPKVHLHFTPTYSSWLNQVELWFGRIERYVVARGVFTSVNDLARKLMRYIRHHNQHAAPSNGPTATSLTELSLLLIQLLQATSFHLYLSAISGETIEMVALCGLSFSSWPS
jgi:transposase